jgi:predicted small lipoprotein YifL
MMRRSFGVLVVLLAMAACGREGPLIGTAVVSPPAETPTPLLTLAPSPSPTAEATSSPEATTAEPEETATTSPGGGDNAGIFGSVVAGPTCPVEQSSSPCPERPVPDAEVTAKEGDRVAGTARTDSNGKFTMRLVPGTYDVTASSPSVMSCETEEVTVAEHQYQPVRINCDTGIR